MLNRISLLICSLMLSTITLAHEWDGKDYSENSSSQMIAAMRLLEPHDLQKGASVLDIGCGDGKITAAINKGLGGKTVGLDLSDSMIAFAKDRFSPQAPSLQFVVGNAAELDFSEQFDYVTSFTALQWVKNQQAAVQGMFAALKPGGKLFITMPKHYPECLSNAILDLSYDPEFSESFIGFESGQVFFGVDEYRTMLTKAGFIDSQVCFVEGFDKFPSVDAFKNFVKQWLPWAQVFEDESLKEAFMNRLMERYVAFCPVAKDGSLTFYKQHLEAVATKPSSLSSKEEL